MPETRQKVKDMAIGLLIIGDEILSGRRADKHFPKLVSLLAERGMRLGWAEIISDDPAQIIATLRRTFDSNDIVFSCGGIGATPDDRTRQCAAEALGVPLVLHPEARIRIEERIADMARAAGSEPALADGENRRRLQMGEFPQGADIIPNTYNKIPGFSVRHQTEGAHYFMPGFPVMTWPMMEWILDTHYFHLFHRDAWLEQSVLVYGSAEATLIPLMEMMERDYPGISIFSLPHVGEDGARAHIELGTKGKPEQVRVAFANMLEALAARGIEFDTN